jgi:hypothetical protein
MNEFHRQQWLAELQLKISKTTDLIVHGVPSKHNSNTKIQTFPNQPQDFKPDLHP